MKKILLLFLFLIPLFAFSQKEVESVGFGYYFYNSQPYTGQAIVYYKNGVVMEKGKCKGGYRLGKWTFYYKNGNKIKEGNYKIEKEKRMPYKGGPTDKPSPGGIKKVSLQSGKWTFYYKNGNIEKECMYIIKKENRKEGGYDKVSQLSGKWTYWDEEGNEIDEKTWRNNILKGKNDTCKTIKGTDEALQNIPDINTKQLKNILKKTADELIISRLGEQNFQSWNNITYKYPHYKNNFYFNKSIKTYGIFYRFVIPDISYYTFEIHFDAYSKKLYRDIKTILPDCVNYPEECKFITMEEAKKNAVNSINGLPKPKFSSNKFLFYEKNETFAWYFYHSKYIDYPKQRLVIVYIDANSGDVLHKVDTIHNNPKCLPPQTLIATPHGSIPIRDIAVGDTIWTLNKEGSRIAVSVVYKNVAAVKAHRLAFFVLEDGRILYVSPMHPGVDGIPLGELQIGEELDGSKIIKKETVNYKGTETQDILPEGKTGFYWANGILIGSTLSEKFLSGK